jgi:antitoxin component of RelBE/YafQ-DinJ toxin-antitoxin module
MRAPKKSETIEIRLSYEAKSAFARRCHEDGVSASEAIRTMIDGRIADRHDMPIARRAYRSTIAAIIAGMVLGAGVAVPALAHGKQTGHAAFDQLDRNHDGVLSYGEFSAR